MQVHGPRSFDDLTSIGLSYEKSILKELKISEKNEEKYNIMKCSS